MKRLNEYINEELNNEEQMNEDLMGILSSSLEYASAFVQGVAGGVSDAINGNLPSISDMIKDQLKEIMEGIVWLIIKILIAWELIKAGAKVTVGFIKGLFTTKSYEEIGKSLGEKALNKLVVSVKNLVHKTNKKELVSIAKSIYEVKHSKENQDEALEELSKKLGEMRPDEYAQVMNILDDLCKNDKIVSQLKKALDLK